MSANPLEFDPQREHRIRERAYHLWNDEGRPHGRDAEFWERARELVGMEESAGAGQLPNPQTTGEDPRQTQPIEEAFLEENLGEFPGRFTDQGDIESSPHARHTPRAAPEAIAPAPAKALPSKPAGKKTGKATGPAPENLPAKPSLKAKALKETKTTPEKSPEKSKGKQKSKD